MRKVWFTVLISLVALGAACSPQDKNEQEQQKEHPDGNHFLGVSPHYVELDDLTEGADIVVTTNDDSYITEFCLFSPAYDYKSAQVILEDCYDGSFTEYEDEWIKLEQLSATEYHFVVKPREECEASRQWYFNLLPSYVTSHASGFLKDETFCIIYTPKE